LPRAAKRATKKETREETAMSDERDDAGATDADEFVVAAEDFDAVQLPLMTAALDDAGVPHLCTGEELATIRFDWRLDAKLLVPARLLERARAVIAEALSGPGLPDDAEDDLVAAGHEGEPPDDGPDGNVSG
jgi:hypothetical protein